MTRRTVETARPTGSDLDRLLETERRLEALVAEARAEAAAAVARAREEAERREKEEEAHVAAAVRELEQTFAREVEDREAEVRRIAAAEAARYRAVSPDGVTQLAVRAVARLLAWAAEGDT